MYFSMLIQPRWLQLDSLSLYVGENDPTWPNNQNFMAWRIPHYFKFHYFIEDKQNLQRQTEFYG